MLPHRIKRKAIYVDRLIDLLKKTPGGAQLFYHKMTQPKNNVAIIRGQNLRYRRVAQRDRYQIESSRDVLLKIGHNRNIR